MNHALEGGHMTLAARRDGAMLTVEVSDTGLGLSAPPTDVSGGVGLTNIRERLAAIYWGQAILSVCENSPPGEIASLSITTGPPLELTPGCAA